MQTIVDKYSPTVFVGYDDREHDAYLVCKHTLLKHASAPVNIVPLKHKFLRKIGLFDRSWLVEGKTGNYKDLRDDKPFSTQFSHSRFAVPALARYLGLQTSYVMFVDCDFLWQDDVCKLFAEAQANGKTVSVVKHDFIPNNTSKMDNQEQAMYAYKLWSSLMVFDIDSKYCPTIAEVNHWSGRALHQFDWLHKNDIGSLNERWNWIPSHSEPRVSIEEVGAIHYTHGVPTVSEEPVLYGERYMRALGEALKDERTMEDWL